MIKEFTSNSVEETEEIARAFAKNLKKGDFIAMYGDLGVGKTAFVRALASVLAKAATVKSPTYTIVNEYRGDGIKIYHFDVYRITDDDDLYSVGFYDYLKKGICICEWSENIPWAIPENAKKVKIERLGDGANQRKITIEA
ncbi:MAG: tRNA (adenosine(37)-N6)-threonylcarbamoyltransferase complex ATPase subunit type 1 TsaE [Clostridia bacterium]|nr:tRNA (adenosine(37)-N6)-threonylcarbamoyltransferase complex ATPase subunit type 1 TsaE [Clostridia bacterium]